MAATPPAFSFARVYEEKEDTNPACTNPALLTPDGGERYKSTKILVAGAKEVRKSTILRADPESPIHSARLVSQQQNMASGVKKDGGELKEEEESSERLEEEGEEEEEGDIQAPKNHTFRFLALGDSYTVGEGLHVTKSFPNEVARLLSAQRQQEQGQGQGQGQEQEQEQGQGQRQGQGQGQGPEQPRRGRRQRSYRAVSIDVVAKTGWTTDELLKAMSESDACEASRRYDLVTLLIGVNNQYRGRSSSEYAADFEVLLKKAIEFANGQPERVVVLSIPDWGITPFAKDRNKFFISGQIDEFNAINLALAKRYRAKYVNVTPWTREAETLPGLLADDGLHPSGKEYSRWAVAVVKIVHDYEAKIRKQTSKADPVSDCVLDFGKLIQNIFFWA